MKNKTISQLQEIIIAFGGKAYQGPVAFNFIHQKFARSLDEFTTLKKDLRASLVSGGYFLSNLKVAEKLCDPDGTEKYLFTLSDGNNIETVLLRESDRNTICISCQVGCKLGCKFCATGFLKFQRDLTAGEIVDQVIKIAADAGKINNIVFMGMGEPMYNYDNCLKAVWILTDPKGLNIGIRKQTISTCGLPDGIRALAEEDIYPRLAVSLHAASDTLRKKLMPIASKHPMAELVSAMRYYQQKTSRRITIEYCMIKCLNDSLSDAQALAALLRPLRANVNLIEYNPHPGCDFQGSSSRAIKAFKDTLMQSGVETIVRYRRGRNIKAACGQLGADRIKK
ncbi:MAG: 23S rRNA (adenine(2503)-C(2))-methyltransferase RlmN [Anaerohalosphaeraceae bacterium]|nr:23S rRNA (adenine(2503)-C(2))-methyltransferase RlmN [Anaerohalosphaeraceae bacterium]